MAISCVSLAELNAVALDGRLLHAEKDKLGLTMDKSIEELGV